MEPGGLSGWAVPLWWVAVIAVGAFAVGQRRENLKPNCRCAFMRVGASFVTADTAQLALLVPDLTRPASHPLSGC